MRLIVSEADKDIWPEDISHFPGRPGVFHCGYLPPAALLAAQDAIRGLYLERRFNIVRRVTP